MARRIALLVLLGVCAFVSAQSVDTMDIDLYGMGDQTFSINAGLLVPLFFFGFEGAGIEPAGAHLRVGATGSLRWGTFLSNSLSVGAELGGMFASTVLGRTLISIPVTGIIDYAFRFHPFELSLHGNLGINFLRIDNDLYIGPILRPGFSFYWNYNAEWSFGLRSEYWFIPEIYPGTEPPASQSRFANMLTTTLSTLYHF